MVLHAPHAFADFHPHTFPPPSPVPNLHVPLPWRSSTLGDRHTHARPTACCSSKQPRPALNQHSGHAGGHCQMWQGAANGAVRAGGAPRSSRLPVAAAALQPPRAAALHPAAASAGQEPCAGAVQKRAGRQPRCFLVRLRLRGCGYACVREAGPLRDASSTVTKHHRQPANPFCQPAMHYASWHNPALPMGCAAGGEAAAAPPFTLTRWSPTARLACSNPAPPGCCSLPCAPSRTPSNPTAGGHSSSLVMRC